MSNPEWGVKRVCPETGKRFYDLNKTPIISPYTGKVVAIDHIDRRAEENLAALKAKARATVDEDDDLLVEDDDSVDVDDELLEEDDDDTVALDDLADVPGGDDD